MAFRPRHRSGTSSNQVAKQLDVQSLRHIWVKSHREHEENNKSGENLKLLSCLFFSLTNEIGQTDFQNNTDQIILK